MLNETFVTHALIIRTLLFHIYLCFSPLINMCSKGKLLKSEAITLLNKKPFPP